jgi:HK97 family phage major capsid protein
MEIADVANININLIGVQKMSKLKIRITKADGWVNGETTWPLGQLLNCEEKDAHQLVKDGVAEIYEAKAGDVLAVSPDGGNMTKEEIQGIIAEVLKENTAANKTDKVFNEDGFAKQGNFQCFAEFAHDIYKSQTGRNVTEKLAKWNKYVSQVESKAPTGASEGISADGGFLVPTEFRNQLLKDSLDAAIIRPRATVIPMATNSVKIPFVNESSRASSVYGGVVIYRPAEGGTKTASKPVFGNIQLTLHKLVGLVYVTDELLEDSPISMQPLLTTMFSEAIASQEDYDFVNGTGANQALGVLNAPCLVSQAKESGQAATSIVTENIVKMWSRLKPRSLRNAIWLAAPDAFPQLATLTLNVGTGGSSVGLLQNVAGSPQMTLLGRPLILTDICQTVGSVGDIILGDWSKYLIGSKASGLQVASSIHVNFTTDETAFRFVLRYDGQPWEATALTQRNSSANTLSSFVALAVRE